MDCFLRWLKAWGVVSSRSGSLWHWRRLVALLFFSFGTIEVTSKGHGGWAFLIFLQIQQAVRMVSVWCLQGSKVQFGEERFLGGVGAIRSSWEEPCIIGGTSMWHTSLWAREHWWVHRWVQHCGYFLWALTFAMRSISKFINELTLWMSLWGVSLVSWARMVNFWIGPTLLFCGIDKISSEMCTGASSLNPLPIVMQYCWTMELGNEKRPFRFENMLVKEHRLGV